MKGEEGWGRVDAVITAVITAGSAAAWPLLVSFLGVLLTFWVARRGQAGTDRKDRASEQTDFRRDVLTENRDLRERLGTAERRADALAVLLNLSQVEVLALKAHDLEVHP